MQRLHLENLLTADGMQTKRVLVFGRRHADLSVLNVVAGTALYRF